MSSSSEAKTKRYPTGRRWELAGEIDASFKPPDEEPGGTLVIDLIAVGRITSFGVREWIRALKAARPDRLYFVHARPSLVAQFNMVSGFAGNGRLVSLYLPYVCPNCDDESEVLMDLRTESAQARAGEPPPHTCARCGAATELDDIPETYLAFAAAQPDLVVAETDIAIIEGIEPADDGRRLRVHKDVGDGVTGVWLDGDLDDKARLRRAFDGLEGLVVVSLAGVRKCSVEGARRLHEALVSQGADLWCARVRPALLAVFDEARVEWTLGKTASVMVKSICASCTTHRDVEAPASAIAAEGGEARCTSCGSATPIVLPSEDRARLAPHLAAQVPDVVARWLEGHSVDLPGEGESTRTQTDRIAAPASNKYEILRRIGTGGMAEVLLARQQGMQGFEKKVVVKRILPQLASNAEFVEMFLREARVAARITHPNVVQIYDLGKDGDHYFIAMEYVRGWDLRTALGAATRIDKPVPIGVALRIVLDVCAGLHAAHTCVDDDGKQMGIVHRDVSPHNVLLGLDGAVKVADFGISKMRDGSSGTMPGTLKGKIIYMAPEQIEATYGPVDIRSDVFAVGLVLHECLTGMAVFRRTSEAAALHAVLNAPIPRARALRGEVSEDLDALVAKATTRDRAGRYANCAELQRDLEELVRKEAIAATSTQLSTWLAGIADEATSMGAAPRPGFTPSGTRTGVGAPFAGEQGSGDDAPTVAAKLEPQERVKGDE